MKTIREQLEQGCRSELESLNTLIAASQAISLKRIADALTCTHGDTLADWIWAGVMDRRS